jgi:hypothetical protein
VDPDRDPYVPNFHGSATLLPDLGAVPILRMLARSCRLTGPASRRLLSSQQTQADAAAGTEEQPLYPGHIPTSSLQRFIFYRVFHVRPITCMATTRLSVKLGLSGERRVIIMMVKGGERIGLTG